MKSVQSDVNQIKPESSVTSYPERRERYIKLAERDNKSGDDFVKPPRHGSLRRTDAPVSTAVICPQIIKAETTASVLHVKVRESDELFPIVSRDIMFARSDVIADGAHNRLTDAGHLIRRHPVGIK